MTATEDPLSQPQHEGHSGAEVDTATAERIPMGRNPRHFGIDPGEPWPDDVPMNQDDRHWRYEDDPKGARRAELKVAAAWTVSLLASIGLAVVYIISGNNQLAGLCWALAFAGLGIGLILWARDLLPGHDVIASRGHHGVSLEGDRVAVAESFGRGIEPMARRSFLLKVLAPVGGVFGLATIFPLASLGSRPKSNLYQTYWGKGTRAVTQDGAPVRPADIPVNGILTVFPEGHMDDALSPTLLINVGTSPFRITKETVGWNLPVAGGGNIVAFSKICTHAGCPASLYNVQSHQLVCPCHQSTFDVLEDCKPVFGPAPRSLPQLPLTVNSDGYIVSQSNYTQAVGPGFWSRG